MSRIRGHVFSQEEFPIGRLVPIRADYDSQEKILEFLVPSHSEERKDTVYGVEVDVLTGEVACGCTWWACELNTDDGRSKGIAGRKQAGTYLETAAMATTPRVYLCPSILRLPSGLCYHCKRVRAWLKAHDLYNAIETHAKEQEDRLKARLERQELRRTQAA